MKFYPRLRKPAYITYYQEKRKEYPWLDNQFKTKEGLFEKTVEDHAQSSGFAYVMFLAVPLALIYGGIFLLVLLGNAGTSMRGYVPVPAFFIILIIFIIIPLLRARKKVHYNWCEKCECPNAWVVVNSSSRLSSVKTTTTTTRYKNTDAIDSLLGYRDSKKTKTEEWYLNIEDWECLNCGHTEHREYTEQYNARTPEEFKDWK
jgi:hypothetical protein